MRKLVRRRRWFRRILGAFLVFHVAAIVVAPASVEPTSPLWLTGWRFVQPYVQLTFLDQGWNFFSPEPGPSTLISYRAHLPDGRVVDERMPSKEVWPRLLYHRHFMLTSYVGYQPEDGQEVLCEGYIDHIAAKHQTDEIEFSKLIHLLPSQEHIGNGGDQQHAELWEELAFVNEESIPDAGLNQPDSKQVDQEQSDANRQNSSITPSQDAPPVEKETPAAA